MVQKKRYKYLSNHNLLIEIAKSKNSYSSYVEPHHSVYDAVVHLEAEDSVADALPTLHLSDWTKSYAERVQAAREALADDPEAEAKTAHILPIVRVMTYEHIPPAAGRSVKAREKNKTHQKVNFLPFQHWELTEGEGWRCVGKSHWVGGLHNGHFSIDHGRLTDEMGKMVWLLAERFSTKGSWRGYSYREDFVGEALENLMEVALRFDETQTQNPFAYYTQCVTNSFRRVWRDEEQHRNIRDDLLIASGVAPSMTRQVEHELAKFEPPKLVAKRGRKPKGHPQS